MTVETVVDLLRHGEVAGDAKLRGARTDEPLTARGWDDLSRIARHAGPWDVIVSPPLQRCQVFARSLASKVRRRLIVDERLMEYDFGEWDGRPLATLWAEQGDAFAAFLADPDRVPPPGGEQASDFRGRVRAAWGELAEHEAGRRILLIGNGGVLRQLVADALDAPPQAQVRLEWPPAALTRLRIHDDPPHPRSLSLAFHAWRPDDAENHG